ncbi:MULTISPECIES: hypothetical protein [unclassified Pseudomonas]|uniref:hypothetical protein n=1 Tax=unclassified Pseudomonas TaxID=196821 RepID=UPI000C87EE90|nr:MULTISPECIES: hypothetical protein [unclassified Pseudomonas]DAF68364.1 MAG TPA: hypothetical protein [Caudoviricetes sp.]PMX08447.1 hypothetical protein C1Y25_24035 [Pseudomonas sp. MPBC4-3]PMX44685.1 hypothetical protein C1Y20_24265 [Pseudomonas sp. FW301-21B01]PMY02228.1 hypothetical protein C1Y18_31305 [Pseudomonas sp. MPR-R5A]PNA65238.1 hypothetical protein C1Y14_24455 [Pseudomonas sp. MPR-R5B]
MQAIVTKYLGPTNTKTSRIKAYCLTDTKGLTVSWDHGKSSDENHKDAAEAFKALKNWSNYTATVMGSMPDGTMAHVFVPRVG